jgi:hypothetical protein
VVIWCISTVLVFWCREKSGNPGLAHKQTHSAKNLIHSAASIRFNCTFQGFGKNCHIRIKLFFEFFFGQSPQKKLTCQADKGGPIAEFRKVLLVLTSSSKKNIGA